MSNGLKVYSSSGQLSFDSSRLGGVALDSYRVTLTTNVAFVKNYTIPSGSDINIIITPNSSAYRSDLLTVTKTVSGTSASTSITSGVGLTINVIIILR